MYACECQWFVHNVLVAAHHFQYNATNIHSFIKTVTLNTQCMQILHTRFRLCCKSILFKFTHFLPCDAMRCTVSVILILSVCPSVHPSVTLVHCVHMALPTIMISSPYGSPIILVSGDIMIIPKFEGGHPERGR